MFLNEFYQDLVIIFNTFCSQDFLETLEEESGNLLPFFPFDGEVNDGAAGMEGGNDFVLVVTGKDESAIANELLSKRP